VKQNRVYKNSRKEGRVSTVYGQKTFNLAVYGQSEVYFIYNIKKRQFMTQ